MAEGDLIVPYRTAARDYTLKYYITSELFELCTFKYLSQIPEWHLDLGIHN